MTADDSLQSRHFRRAPAGRAVRVYASRVGQARVRRATDLLVLAAALLALASLIVAYPPGDFERSLESFLASWPGWLDPVWDLIYDLLAVWAVVLLLAVLVSRRLDVLLEGVGALLLALLIAVVSARLAAGSWPDLGDAVGGGSETAPFPAIRVAECATVILAVGARRRARRRFPRSGRDCSSLVRNW